MHVQPKFLSQRNFGYTAVELLVAVGIITIITSVVVSSRAGFDSTVSLSNLAYDVALAVREAQLYGINVRRAGTGSATTYKAGYGIHFKTGTDGSDTESSKTSFILFADLDNDRMYDGASELIRQYRISGRSTINKLCFVLSGFSGCTNTDTLDVTFRRPDPDACLNIGFTLDDGVGDPGVESTSYCLATVGIVSAQIILGSSSGSARTINIYSTGEISVTTTSTVKPRPEQIAPVAPPVLQLENT